MLTSARNQYREQQIITARALREARRVSTRGAVAVATVISAYQLEAAGNTFGYTDAVLAEQGINSPPEGTAILSALVTGRPAIQMLERSANNEAMERLVLTLVQDAGRTAAAVDLGRRRGATSHIRSLQLPSCSRCAVLAGRVYPYSDGFQRHPRCDCLMTPTNASVGKDLIVDPDRSDIRDLSKADVAALDNGADFAQVVNVRRAGAGLTVGSSVMVRGDRLTPQGVLQASAGDKSRALQLLRANGYIVR